MDYIDRDTAIRTAIEMCVKVVGHGITQIDAVNIANEFENIPSADVVPKSELEQLKRNLEQCENGYSQELHLARCQLADAKTEVEKLQKELEIWKQNRFNLFQRLGCYEMAKQKVASEIFKEIERTCVDTFGNFYIGSTRGAFAELKKKYTEGKQ